MQILYGHLCIKNVLVYIGIIIFVLLLFAKQSRKWYAISMKKDEEILVEGGLSVDEAYVYNALLEKGAQKASQVATWTGINRTLVYKALDKLESIGAVEKSDRAQAISIFKAAHPSAFVVALEKRKEALERTTESFKINIGPLISRFNLLSGKPNVQFFEGYNGVRKVVFDSLNSKTEILSFADNEAVNRLYPELNKEYLPMRKKLAIKKRLISIDTPYIRTLAKGDDLDITERRVIQENFSFATVIQIYDNKISYITLEKERSLGVIIEDMSIYEMHRTLFEVLWKNAILLDPVLEK